MCFRIFDYANFRISTLRFIRKAIEIYAFIFFKGFYCNSLKGLSHHQITIHSDLSVSCNCRDIYGGGTIGSLKTHNFQEIFSGDTASNFRKQLAKGKLPLLECVICGERKTTKRESALKQVHEYRLPYKGIRIENTNKCNLKCKGCPLDQLYKTRPPRNMPLKDMTNISQMIKKELNIQKVHYYDLGEPFLSNSILDELTILRKNNPGIKLITSTNGLLINNNYKRDITQFYISKMF